MRIKVRTPASAGELLEGQVEGVRQLISLPINLYNELLIEYEKIEGTQSTDHISLPELAHHPKAHAAMQLFYNIFELPRNEYHLSFVFNDAIVVGKGLASSTADILNMIYGLAHIHQINLTPTIAAKIALQIEPSDSTMFEALYLYDFIEGSRFESVRRITVSFGVAEFEALDERSELLQKADEALYLAKRNGRNRVEIFKS